jgi:hypothetical protein
VSRVVAWVLLASTLGLGVAWVVVGEQETPYSELRAAVAEGDVEAVTVYGPTAPFRGHTDVQVRWRTGPFGAFQRLVVVTEQRPQRVDRRHGRAVVEDVGADLTALDPDLAVERHNDWTLDDGEMFGRTVPTWLLFAAIGTWLGTFLLLLVGCPSPSRATRWAWFWILGLVPPLGVVGFLLLSGVTGRLPSSRPEERLTGGWAFLLTFIVNGVVQTAVLNLG